LFDVSSKEIFFAISSADVVHDGHNVVYLVAVVDKERKIRFVNFDATKDIFCFLGNVLTTTPAVEVNLCKW
jgi:hypothetical protein